MRHQRIVDTPTIDADARGHAGFGSNLSKPGFDLVVKFQDIPPQGAADGGWPGRKAVDFLQFYSLSGEISEDHSSAFGA